jgi:hypothetical protein
MFQRFSPGNNLNDAFRQAFKTELDEDTLNHSHQIIIIASSLDAATAHHRLSERERYCHQRGVLPSVSTWRGAIHQPRMDD